MWYERPDCVKSNGSCKTQAHFSPLLSCSKIERRLGSQRALNTFACSWYSVLMYSPHIKLFWCDLVYAALRNLSIPFCKFSRNRRLMSIKFSCVTLRHMSIRVALLISLLILFVSVRKAGVLFFVLAEGTKHSWINHLSFLIYHCAQAQRRACNAGGNCL